MTDDTGSKTSNPHERLLAIGLIVGLVAVALLLAGLAWKSHHDKAVRIAQFQCELMGYPQYSDAWSACVADHS